MLHYSRVSWYKYTQYPRIISTAQRLDALSTCSVFGCFTTVERPYVLSSRGVLSSYTTVKCLDALSSNGDWNVAIKHGILRPYVHVVPWGCFTVNIVAWWLKCTYCRSVSLRYNIFVPQARNDVLMFGPRTVSWCPTNRMGFTAIQCLYAQSTRSVLVFPFSTVYWRLKYPYCTKKYPYCFITLQSLCAQRTRTGKMFQNSGESWYL